MAIRDAETIPLGVPPYFLADQLARGANPADIVSPDPGSLLEEYYDAYGHVYRFGHVIEQRFPPGASPRQASAGVALRAAGDLVRHGCMRQHIAVSVAEMIPLLDAELLAHLRAVLPKTLLLLGCQPEGRRYP